MHLTLFALALVALPSTTPAQVEPTAVSAIPAGLLAGHLEIRLGFRARGPTPSGAALEVGSLLAALRDSLRGRRFGDSAVQMALRSLAPAPVKTDSATGYDATIALTVGATELPRLPELLATLAAAGPVAVSDVQVKLEPTPPPYAALLAQAVAASEQERLTLPAIGGKIGTIALIILAIRRELRR